LWSHPIAPIVEKWMEQLRTEKKGGQPVSKVVEGACRRLAEELESVQHFPFAEYSGAKDASAKLEVLRGWLDKQESYLLKPMNCPHHIQIYKAEQRSYRDLPVRLAEFGTVYRFEQTGELSGMTRVRGFTQDDAHLFITEDQIGQEFGGCIDFTRFFLNTLGLNEYRVRLGFRDPASDKYVGSDAAWSKAQEAIQRVAESMGLPQLHIEPGEA